MAPDGENFRGINAEGYWAKKIHLRLIKQLRQVMTDSFLHLKYWFLHWYQFFEKNIYPTIPYISNWQNLYSIKKMGLLFREKIQ